MSRNVVARLSLLLAVLFQGVALHVRKEVNSTLKACHVPEGMVQIRTAAGFDMVVLNYGDIVSDHLRQHGWWEIQAAKDMLRPYAEVHAGDTFLDIGCNLGYYSLMFAQAGYRVLCVEPMARNLKAIAASLCLNPNLQDMVHVLPVALVSPDQVKTKCIVRATNTDINRGNGHMYCGGNVTACTSWDSTCSDVPVMTLNALLAREKPSSVNVVKMDIEEFECKVLAGGDTLFSKFSPQVAKIETFYSATACWKPVMDKYGYRMETRHTDSWIFKPPLR